MGLVIVGAFAVVGGGGRRTRSTVAIRAIAQDLTAIPTASPGNRQRHAAAAGQRSQFHRLVVVRSPL